MTENGFSTTFTVSRPPQQVFAAVTDVRGWWSRDIVGDTDRLGAVFDYRYENAHRCRFRMTELIPDRRVSWLVLDNYFDFTTDATEWTGTTVSFDITAHDEGTDVSFTHEGLVPEYECYELCSTGWGFYVNQSLRELIETGHGRPNSRNRPRLPAERAATARAS